jgi:LysR family hydrogen peroxide-inducible transcriptional activator
MTLTQLRYLVTLADHGHFGRAAEACGVSQPTLSAQIAKLERYLDAPLVVRGGGRVALNALGERVVARARTMLELAEEVKGVARRGESPLLGPFRLGVIPTLCPYLLPWALPALRARFPRLELVCCEVQTAEALIALRRRELDAAIAANPIDAAGVETVPLFDEPFLAAVPPDHPLAGEDAVGLAAFAREKLLVLEEGHCLRDHALSLCDAADPGAGGARATSLETLLGLVGVGEGVTLAPALAAQGRASPALRPFDPPVSRRIVLAHATGAARRGEMRLFAGALRAAAPAALIPIVYDYERD